MQVSNRAVLATLLLAIAACSRPPLAEVVVGTYFANHGKGTDRLELKADGTYEHELSDRNTELLKHQRGTWAIEVVADEELVVLRNFEHWWRGLEVPGNSYWAASPIRRGNRIRFSLDDDRGWYFERVTKESPK